MSSWSWFLKCFGAHFVYCCFLYLHIREIFRVLDLMKVDMINATILSLRAVLCREGIEYERASFQRILDKTPSKCTIIRIEFAI